MNLEEVTALVLAVGGIITALGALLNHLGNKKKIDFDRNRDSVTEWKEIANTYKQDYKKLVDRLEELETTVKESNDQHRLERDKWKQERESILRENSDLNERITVLEEALVQEGIDVDEL